MSNAFITETFMISDSVIIPISFFGNVQILLLSLQFVFGKEFMSGWGWCGLSYIPGKDLTFDKSNESITSDEN